MRLGTVGVVLLLGLVGCSSPSPSSTEATPTAAPRYEQITLPTLPSSTTAVPLTTIAAPTVPVTVVVLTIPNRPTIALPPGVTVADQQAAEAAANAWWIEVDSQFQSLPNNDPSKLLALAYPGKPAGPAMMATLDRISKQGRRWVAGTVREQRINTTVFVENRVDIEVCVANNNFFIDGTGNRYDEGLGASYITTAVEKSNGVWLVVDFGNNRPPTDGVSCEG
jgi:hypothetical protein